MYGLLVALAIIAAVIGFFLLSQATMGVGIVGLGCLAGILARIAQAHEQHQEMMKTMLGKTGAKSA